MGAQSLTTDSHARGRLGGPIVVFLLLATGAAPFMEGGITKVTANGLPTVDIEFPGGGTNSSVSLALPNNSVVISAKLDILGRKYREEVTSALTSRSALLASDLTNVSVGYDAAMLRSVPFLPTDQPYDFFVGYRNATSIATGDLNGDGIPDLAACYDDDAVAGYFPGRSDGSYRAFEAYPMMQTSVPAAVAVGDVNGDGLSDLVVADRGLSSFWVCAQNSSTHRLDPGALYSVGDEVDGAVIADFNSDGLLDVALCAANPCRVTVFTQNQTAHDLGLFGSYTLSPSGSAVSIAAGDLDGDSHADIAAVASDGTLYTLMQQAGGFSSPSAFPLGIGYLGGAVAVGDINDTYAGNEVAVAFAGGGRQGLQVFYRSGGSLAEGSQFTFPTPVPDRPPMALGAGDVDGDGLSEAVLGIDGNDNGVLEVIKSSGAVASYPFVGAARDLAIDDLDGDGLKDVAAACPLRDSIAALHQSSNGTLGRMDELRFVPSVVAVGDLNNDGRQDIAVASRYCMSVGVRYKRSTGPYGPLQSAGPVNDPVALGIADLNGDGLPDLAVLGRGNDTLTVFPQGSQGLGSPAYYATGRFPSALALGDLTGDGLADAVIAQSGEKYISVLSQTAGGDLAANEDYIVGSGASSMALGDFNGDGRTDLAVTVLFSNTLKVFNQTDAGKLAPPATYNVGTDPVAVAAGDYNMDHLADIVVGCAGSPSLSVLLQSSSGGFDRTPDTGLGSPPIGVAVGDVDRDRTPEVWLLARDGNLTLLRQDNKGGLLPPQNYSTGRGPGAFALGDLDGNGRPDIALAVTSGQFYPMVPKDFQNSDGMTYASDNSPILVQTDDLNRDGLTDLLTAGSSELMVYYQTPGGGLSLEGDYQWTSPIPYNIVSGLAAGDLNGDGWDDVAVTGTYIYGVSIFYGGPTGLSPNYTYVDFGIYAYSYGGLAIADVTGDGRPDLIRTSYQYVSVVPQTASGTLGAIINYSPGISYMSGLTVGDINGDGYNDMVAASTMYDRAAVLLSDGSGGFSSTTCALSTGYSYYNTPIVISDLNGDGRKDFAVLSTGAKKVDVFTQQEDGSFLDKTSYDVYQSDATGAGLGAGDIDSDGRNELVVSNSACSNLTIFHQDENGNLVETESYIAGTNPRGLAVADLNSDGVPDIAVVNGGSDDISVFYEVQRRGSIVPPPINVPGGFLDTVDVTWNRTPPEPGCTIKVSVSIDGVNWTAVTNGTVLAFSKVSRTLYRKVELSAASTYPLGLTDMYTTYVHSAFPSDPFLDVGGDGTVDWSLKGNFSKKETVGADILVPALNEYLDAHRNSTGPQVEIPLAVGSSSEGVVEITNISIEYDQPPYQTQPFPDDLSIDENSANNELIDLLSYFADDYDHQLTYELVDVTNASIVNVTIVDNAWVSVDAASWNSSKNWHGEVSFRIRATDSRMLSNVSDTVVVRINPVNYPPVITSTPVLNATVGELYTYMVCATDVENAPLRFILEKGLPGMELNSSTGLLRWLPRAEYLALTDFSVEVVAYDGEMYSAPQMFKIALSPNLPPVISSTPPVTVYVGEDYFYKVNATDPENHSLAYTLMQHPEGMTIDPANGSVAWRPTEGQLGPSDVEIAVTDGYNSVIQNFEVYVSERPVVNRIPVILSLPPLNATANHTYIYQVLARDDDGDPLTFSADPRPQGMSIDNVSGLISWTPKYWQTGNNTVVVRVSDGKDSVIQQFVIYVNQDRVKPQPNLVPISIRTDLSWLVGVAAVFAASVFAAILVVSARKKGAPTRARTKAAPAGPAGPATTETTRQLAAGKAAPVDMIAVDAGGGAAKGSLPPAEEEPIIEMLAFPDAETATRLPWPDSGARRAPLKVVPPPERVAPARHAPPPEEYPQAEQWWEEPAMPVLEPVPLTTAPRPTAADLARMVRSSEPVSAPPPPAPRTKEDEIDEIFRMMGVERRPAPAAPAAQPPPAQVRPPQSGPQPQATQPVQPITPKRDINKTLEELMKMKK